MYCTVEDVTSMMKEGMIDVILGSEFIEDDAERMEKIRPYAEQAVRDADAEIDGYLCKRYPVPMAKPPEIIRKLSKDIAVYNLASRTGINEDDRENTIYIRYKNAISFLLNVAKGTVSIGTGPDAGGAAGSNTGAQDGFRLQSNGRIFSRDTMRGW